MDKLPFYTAERLKSLKEAADNWVTSTGIEWDTAACWHLPISKMKGSIDQAELTVGRKLRRYFNQLDKRVFKAQLRNGYRVKRFITLEYAASVGWHVHGILSTPPHIDQQRFIEDVKQVWLNCVQDDSIGLPLSRLAWCEPVKDHYPQYTTKNSFGPLQNAKGAIDILNTYFGELPN